VSKNASSQQDAVSPDGRGRTKSYNLAVQEVLLDHDNVDRLGIFERQKSKASRTSGAAVAHDGTLDNLTKLLKVLSK
jgi:hypothetical protein